MNEPKLAVSTDFNGSTVIRTSTRCNPEQKPEHKSGKESCFTLKTSRLIVALSVYGPETNTSGGNYKHIHKRYPHRDTEV